MRSSSKILWVVACAANLGCHAQSAQTPDAGPAAAEPEAHWSTRTTLPGVDLETVWGSGNDIFAAGVGPVIAHSGDGGDTFDMEASGLPGQPRFRRFAGTSATDVWLAGDDGAGGPVLLHSSDRGASWQPRAFGDATDIRAVWALDAGQVLIATNDGRILRSEDAGVTWASVYRGTGTRLLALWGSSAAVIYAAGGQAASADGGAGSPDAMAPPGVDVHVDVDDGCDAGVDASAAAPDGAEEEGIVLRSDDGGRTWSSVGVRTPGALLAIWGRPDGSLVAATGAHTSIALTYDSGAHWLEHGLRAETPQLDLTNVWVSPGDGAFFFASPGGLIRGVQFQCTGSVQLIYETTGDAEAPNISAIWGPGSDDVWAVAPDGTIRNRR